MEIKNWHEYTQEERYNLIENLSKYENSLSKYHAQKNTSQRRIKSSKTPKSKKLWEEKLQFNLEQIIWCEGKISEIKAHLEAMKV